MKQLSEDVDIFKISKSWIPKIQNYQILKNEKIEKISRSKKNSDRKFFPIEKNFGSIFFFGRFFRFFDFLIFLDHFLRKSMKNLKTEKHRKFLFSKTFRRKIKNFKIMVW